MNRWWLITALLLIWTGSLAQSNRKFYVDAPKVVMAGESFQVKYILKNPASRNPRFIPPSDVNGLQSYGMSSYTSTQSSVTIINGRLRSTSTYIITWIMTYVAEHKGQFTIPAASVRDGNSTLTSNPVTITVEGETNNGLPKPKNPVPSSNPDENVLVPQGSQKLFVRLVADRTDVYIGEPIYVYARLYSAYRLSLDDMEPAKFPGFWVQDLKMPTRIQAEQVVVNGRNYLAATVDKKLIFPQQSGTLKISPYKLTCSLYDDWGFPYGQKSVASNGLTIRVKPLPQQGKPSSFSGAVGNFHIKIEAPKGQVSVDQAVTIKLVIDGTGNFGLFDVPEPKVPNSFDALEPKTIPQYQATADGMSGRLIKQFIYIPRSGGNFMIPAIEFSYFDPHTKKYVALHTEPIKLSVNGSADTTSGSGYSVYKTSVTQIGNDINYIFTGPIKLRRKGQSFVGSWYFYLIYIVIFILFILIVYFRRLHIKEMSDVRRYRSRKASKVSSRRLRMARKLMQHGQKDQFYEEVGKALWQYIGDKLGVDPAELTRDTLKEKLVENNVAQEDIDALIKLIDDCEYARYGVQDSQMSMENIYARARAIIDKLDTII